jgi:hypothetical protein
MRVSGQKPKLPSQLSLEVKKTRDILLCFSKPGFRFLTEAARRQELGTYMRKVHVVALSLYGVKLSSLTIVVVIVALTVYTSTFDRVFKLLISNC